MSEQELIQACTRNNPVAQRRLYELYAPTMLGVCRRYLERTEDAEDVLVEGFCKVFEHLPQYESKGSFEGWMRRIFANEALMFLRKKDTLRNAFDIADQYDLEDSDQQFAAALEAQDILFLLDQMPQGYRTVFNLYVVEGYKHREIADLLGISINTSKSQLILAKKRLQEALVAMDYPGARQQQMGNS